MRRRLLAITLTVLLTFTFFIQQGEPKDYPGGYDDAGDPFIPVTPDDYTTFVHPETLDPDPHSYPHIDIQYKGEKVATIKLPMRFLGKKLELIEEKVVIDENGREVQIKRYITKDGDEIEIRISKDERGNPVIEITIKYKDGKVIKVKIYKDKDGNIVIEINGKQIILPPGTRAEIELQEDGSVVINIYDKDGKLIGTIIIRPDGTVEENWNDNDDNEEGKGNGDEESQEDNQEGKSSKMTIPDIKPWQRGFPPTPAEPKPEIFPPSSKQPRIEIYPPAPPAPGIEIYSPKPPKPPIKIPPSVSIPKIGGVLINPKLSNAGKGGSEIKEKVLKSRPSEDSLSWPVELPR